MANDTPVLLIGSVPLKDTETVLRALGDKLGTRAARYPDGETGERTNWIRWQRRIFEGNPAFTLKENRVGFSGIKDTLSRPFYRFVEGVSDAQIAFGSLGFADEAAKSYAVFTKLKRDGVIPRITRFQVCLPTVVAILSGFVVVEDRARAEPALEKAMQREVEQIAGAIPAAELSIQWDVCMEIVGYDGGYELHYGDILANSVKRVTRQIAFAPTGVEVGIHLCYGDPGHKHIVEPKDTASSVAFSNAICAAADRNVAWIHMPIPRGWMDDSYYAPLAGLKIPCETELYLGLVHLTTGEDSILKRARAARRYVKSFGISTECGFGRRDPATIPGLLELMGKASDDLAKVPAA
jgi:hypothetical protein